MKNEPPKSMDLEDQLEEQVRDQLTRFPGKTGTDSMVLYLIHRDLQALLQELRTRKADDSRRQAGF